MKQNLAERRKFLKEVAVKPATSKEKNNSANSAGGVVTRNILVESVVLSCRKPGQGIL